MLLFVLTEAALFALLLASYFSIRFRNTGPWPQGGLEEPQLVKPAVMTAVILTAGATAFLAVRAEGRRRTGLLALTLLLGALFVGLQAWEYVDTLALFSPQANAYASLFFTITGVHGAHVALGLLLLAWALFCAHTAEAEKARRTVHVTSLYWLFLPVAWLFVFVLLYLTVRV
jgi:heme/copper-type cytochrome/quinol oxidase subunit 3